MTLVTGTRALDTEGAKGASQQFLNSQQPTKTNLNPGQINTKIVVQINASVLISIQRYVTSGPT